MGGILGIGVTGLNAAQLLISTVGHNIANSANDNFSRQRTDLLTQEPQFLARSLIGSGVKVGATTRAVDEVLQRVHRSNIAEEEKWRIEESFSSQINSLLSSEDTGITSAIDNFFGSLQELATQTPSPQHRQVLLSQSESLAQRANTLEDRFNEMQTDIETQMRESMETLNSLADSLIKVNNDIINTGNLSAFSNPNDLEDLRDGILKDISELVDITVVEQSTGAVDVFLGNGVSFVVGGVKSVFGTARNNNDLSELDLVTVAKNTNTVITDNMTGGKIGGMLEFRDDVLAPTRAKIGRIMMTLAMTFNAQHELGLDQNGDFGDRFFTDYNALSLQLARALNNSQNIGTAQFRVEIDAIPRPEPGPFEVTTDGSNLIDVGTMGLINTGDLSINGITIRNPLAADDTLSTVDNTGSAIAVSTAINDFYSGTNVTATANQNVLSLGNFTTGAVATGQFLINGVDIVSTGASVETMVTDINASKETTGVRAESTDGVTIHLIAEDGRNIQLQTDGTGSTGDFEYFNSAGVTALNQVKRAGITLSHLDTAITIGGFAPGDVGLTAGVFPPEAPSLTDSDYSLLYLNGNYTMVRLEDSTTVYSGSSPNINVDGFSMSLNNGAVAEGDSFIIRPTMAANKEFAINLKRIDKLAMASPIRVQSEMGNSGTGIINRGKIVATTGNGTTTNSYGNAFTTDGRITPPIRIEFFSDEDGNPTRYRVYDVSGGSPGVQIGVEQPFRPNDDNQIFPLTGVIDFTPPGPNDTYTYDPGYRISITGAPDVGDEFFVEYNINGPSDDGNAQEMLSLKTEKLLSNGTVNYQEAYSQTITRIGAISQTIEINFKAAQSLKRESLNRVQSVSGVNLDEEAAKLIRYQQAYRAAAQVVTVGGSLFDSLLDAVRR